VRVQLADAFGDVLVEAITDADGRAALAYDLAPDAAARVVVPALGLDAPIDRNQPQLLITIPDGGAP
jgi:hypothetical protein